VDPEADHPELIKDFGLYKVKSDDGKDLVGWVFPNLLDLDGTALPLAMFTNGSQAATQESIVGVRSGDGTNLPDGGAPSGKGCFYQTLANGRTQATIPFDVQGNTTSPEGTESVIATTFDGRQVELHVGAPNIQGICEVDEGGAVLIPESFKWLPLGQADEVSLVEDPAQFTKSAGVQSMMTVTIRSGGMDSFSLSGMPVEKLASESREFISFDDATMILAGLGIEPKHAMSKLGEAVTWSMPTDVRINRPIHTASEMRKQAAEGASAVLQYIPALRVDLVKEAAAIPDPVAVDTVLSLGFVNPENLTTFIGYLPKIDEAQSHMCELLIAARLGLREIPTSPLEKAIKAVEEVIEGLKVLAFQKSA
jgi:hypothetical protein